MPSILNDEDKQTVKKTVPKPSNKIHAVAVARLYVAYPDRRRWTYTGLQGAAVLANDLVGNTLWIKLVDISPAKRGVIWDQEIYDTFSYNQDRTFFHTFELEDCLAGLSFADEKEAKTFRKKIDDREKNAHRNTRSRPFNAGSGSVVPASVADGDRHHSRLGSLFGYRHSGGHHEHTSSTASADASYTASSESIAPQSRNVAVNISDPSIQSLLAELKDLGITEDQIQNNADFINSYISERKKEQERVAAENADRRQRAPPPPPPTQVVNGNDRIKHSISVSSQDTSSSSSGSRRGPPPAPPPARRTVTTQRQASPVRPEMPHTQTLPASNLSPPRFRAPPPIADAGKFAKSDVYPAKTRTTSPTAESAPPPPPRPPKVAVDESEPAIKPAAIPSVPARRNNASPSQIPSDRSLAPPLPPVREPPPSTASPVHVPTPPSLPKVSNPPVPTVTAQRAPPSPPLSPAFPGPDSAPPAPKSDAPPPPPLPPPSATPAAIPAAPPPPPSIPTAPPPPPIREPQVPPPPPSDGAPPPPALPPPAPALPPVRVTEQDDADSSMQPLPTADPGRGGLLADIRGGSRLKKVSESEKRDRSAAIVPGSASSGPAASGAGSSGGAAVDGGLAGALASALAARKSKVVSHSDDEDDKDDW